MKRAWIAGWLAALSALMCTASVAAAVQPLRPFEPDSYRQIIEAHRGQPFVVMLWSLDCEYCLASFQALEQARRKTGLKVVTIATDPADDPQSAKRVLEKMRSAGLRSQAWAFGSAAPERLRHAIDPKWRGELPRTYWFDRQGRIAAHSGVVTPQVVQHFRSLQ